MRTLTAAIATSVIVCLGTGCVTTSLWEDVCRARPVDTVDEVVAVATGDGGVDLLVRHEDGEVVIRRTKLPDSAPAYASGDRVPIAGEPRPDGLHRRGGYVFAGIDGVSSYQNATSLYRDWHVPVYAYPLAALLTPAAVCVDLAAVPFYVLIWFMLIRGP